MTIRQRTIGNKKARRANGTAPRKITFSLFEAYEK